MNTTIDQINSEINNQLSAAALFPPCTNRGGINPTPCFDSEIELTPPTQKYLFSCKIDYLSFTFSLARLRTLRKVKKHQQRDEVTNNEYEMMRLCYKLGEHVSYLNAHDRHQGLFGYKRSFSLTRDGENCGLVAFDGNNDTGYVSLSGFGCGGVDMVKFHAFIEKLPDVKITRVDIAHDDLEGSKSVTDWKNIYLMGGFAIKGHAPSVKFIEDYDTGAGKTLYVGKKQNGKEACIYEKGKQLGDKESPWVRVEGRITNIDRVIPLDVLITPEIYLAGLYPPFQYLCAFHEAIEVVKKTAKIAYAAMVHYCKQSYGKLIYTMQQLGETPESIIRQLEREGQPKRLVVPFC